jgi:hypothetical protein
MSATEEADSGEEATEDATEQQEEDATTAADDKWIHSAAKKSLLCYPRLPQLLTSVAATNH